MKISILLYGYIPTSSRKYPVRDYKRKKSRKGVKIKSASHVVFQSTSQIIVINVLALRDDLATAKKVSFFWKFIKIMKVGKYDVDMVITTQYNKNQLLWSKVNESLAVKTRLQKLAQI